MRRIAISRTTRLIASACVLALTLGACGSGGYSGLSKAEFIRQAEALCRQANAKLAEIGNSFTSKSTITDLQKAYVNQIVPLVNAEIDQLRALKPPKADRAKVSKMLDDFSTGLDQASADVKAVKSKQELASIAVPPARRTTNSESNAYGIGRCGDASG